MGDIDGELARLGFWTNRRSPPWRPDVCRMDRREALKAILDVKWTLSCQAGHDVGTRRAVEHWCDVSRQEESISSLP